MSPSTSKPMSPSPQSPFLSGNLLLFQVPPKIVAPLGKGRAGTKLDNVTFARHVMIGCALLGLIFGISSLTGADDLDQPPHRALAELHQIRMQENELHLRGKEAFLEKQATPDPGKYIPVSCLDVLEQMKTNVLPVKDPNGGMLHGRQVERDPKFWVSLHNKDFDTTRWDVMVSGDYYERTLSDAFDEVLKSSPPGSRVIDVGGNIGFFTLLSASNGPVIVDAFEPNPKNRLRFCESLNLNQWPSEFDSNNKIPVTEQSKVNLYPFGVGREEGMFTFKENSNPGQGKFGEKATDGEDGFQVVTLDALAKERNWFESRPDIALLKVDVEGLEYNVILGALQLIEAKIVRNIFMEVSARTNKEMELNKPALNLLIEAGYKLHRVGGWRGPGKDPELDPKGNVADQIMERTLDERAKQLNLWWTL